MPFSGFGRRVRFTPVPTPLFGPLLEEIDDLTELKCTLRLIWLLYYKKGFPRYVTSGELLADRVLVKALAGPESDPRSKIHRGVALAVQRGTFLSGSVGRDGAAEQVYVLNTEADGRALSDITGLEPHGNHISTTTSSEADYERPNIFGLYEDNIGMLSPMIAEELKEAEALYPQRWIEDAFREAVTRNKRSWRYVAVILERWEREGKSDGGPVRSPKKAGYTEYLGR